MTISTHPSPSLDVYGRIASAMVRSTEYLDYCHLVKTPDGWRIVNILFRHHD